MTASRTDASTAAAALLTRIFDIAIDAAIALAVMGQTTAFVIALKGQTLAAHPAIVDWVTSPGLLTLGACLAFIKFLLNVIRSFRSPPARLKAALFLLVMLWPLLLPLAFLGVTHAKSGAAAAASPGNGSVAREEHENEAFLKAYDRARARGLTDITQCPRATDAYRGCQRAALEHRQEQFDAGSAWAEQNHPARASGCTGAPNFIRGCRIYYFQQLLKPKPAGQDRYEGMTTAQCKTEVDATYETETALEREDGNAHGAEVTTRRNWLPELAACENYDRLADAKWMPQVYDRLQKLLDRIKAGGTVTEVEKALVRKDFSRMAAASDQPYRAAYLAKADEYFALVNGTRTLPEPAYLPRLSCDGYQAKLADLASQDRERAAAMHALKRADGLISDSARYEQLNQQRKDMLWQWQRFIDGAKAAGCDLKATAS